MGTKRAPTLLEFMEELERAERYLSECEHPLKSGFVSSEVPDSLVGVAAFTLSVVIGGVRFDLSKDEDWQAMADLMTTCIVCGEMLHQCRCGR